jgi:lipoate---protein ligase
LSDSTLRWRLLEDGIEDPFLHFAVEETLLRRVAEGRSVPTLRLRRTVPSVWIGVYQDPREDVDLDYCRQHGLPVVRRPNPGGAVYQDRGTFCTSAFFPRQPAFQAMGIGDSQALYGLLGQVVVALCAGLGVSAQAAPVNDVLVDRRKAYGSAQIELGDAVVHSGTFLVQADLEAMAAALRPSRLKYAHQGFTSVRERVANLAEFVGRCLPVREVMDRFVAAFQARLPVTLEPGSLTGEERQEAEALRDAKYGREAWTFPTRRPFTTSLATRAASGVVLLDLTLADDRIVNLDLRGDFLLGRQERLAAFVQDATGLRIPEALQRLSSSALPADLAGAIARLLTEGCQRPVGAMTERP